MRQHSLIDHAFMQLDQALRTSYGRAHAERANPASGVEDESLSAEDERQAAGLMRINHAANHP